MPKTLHNPFICEVLLWTEETGSGTCFNASNPPQVLVTYSSFSSDGYQWCRWSIKTAHPNLGRIQALVLDKRGYLKITHEPSGHVTIHTRFSGWRKTGPVKLLLRVERLIQPTLAQRRGWQSLGIDQLDLTIGCALPKVVGIDSTMRLAPITQISYQSEDEGGVVRSGPGTFGIQCLGREQSGFRFMSVHPPTFDLPELSQQDELDDCRTRIVQLDPWTVQIWMNQGKLDQLPDGTKINFSIFLVQAQSTQSPPPEVEPPLSQDSAPPILAEPELEF